MESAYFGLLTIFFLDPLRPSQVRVLSDKATTQSVTVAFSFNTSSSYAERWEVQYYNRLSLTTSTVFVDREQLIGEDVEVSLQGLFPGVTYNVTIRSWVQDRPSQKTWPRSATASMYLSSVLRDISHCYND